MRGDLVDGQQVLRLDDLERRRLGTLGSRPCLASSVPGAGVEDVEQQDGDREIFAGGVVVADVRCRQA